MSLVVLLRPKIRETSFNQLLTVLCIVDTFFIFCNTFSCIHALGFKSGKLNYFQVQNLKKKMMHFFFFRFFQNGSWNNGCIRTSGDVRICSVDCGVDLRKTFCHQITSSCKSVSSVFSHVRSTSPRRLSDEKSLKEDLSRS